MPRVKHATRPVPLPWYDRPLTTDLAAAELHTTHCPPLLTNAAQLTHDGNFLYSQDEVWSVSSMLPVRSPAHEPWVLSKPLYHRPGDIAISALSPDGRFGFQSAGVVRRSFGSDETVIYRSVEDGLIFLDQHNDDIEEMRWYDLRTPHIRWLPTQQWQDTIFPPKIDFIADSSACWVSPGHNFGMPDEADEEPDHSTLFCWSDSANRPLAPALPAALRHAERPGSVMRQGQTYLGWVSGGGDLLLGRYDAQQVAVTARLALPLSAAAQRIRFAPDAEWVFAVGEHSACIVRLSWGPTGPCPLWHGVARYAALEHSEQSDGLHHLSFTTNLLPSFLGVAMPTGQHRCVYAVPVTAADEPEPLARFLGYAADASVCGVPAATAGRDALWTATTAGTLDSRHTTQPVRFWYATADDLLRSIEAPIRQRGRSMAVDVSKDRQRTFLQMHDRYIDYIASANLTTTLPFLCSLRAPGMDSVFLGFCQSPLGDWMATVDAPRACLRPHNAAPARSADASWPAFPGDGVGEEIADENADGSAAPESLTLVGMHLRFWRLSDRRATLQRSVAIAIDAQEGVEMQFAPNGTALLLWSFLPGKDCQVYHFLAPEAETQSRRQDRAQGASRSRTHRGPPYGQRNAPRQRRHAHNTPIPDGFHARLPSFAMDSPIAR